MKLTFLGTSSGIPTKERNVSSMALSLDNGEIYLFDCGEGTQHQLQKSDLKSGKVSNIFITHLHGDHIFGLPGLCLSLSNNNPVERTCLNIYGPLGIRKFIFTSLSLSDSRLNFNLQIHEIVPPELSQNDQFLKQYEDSFLNNHLDIHSILEDKTNENQDIQKLSTEIASSSSSSSSLSEKNEKKNEIIGNTVISDDKNDEEGGLSISHLISGKFIKFDQTSMSYHLGKIGDVSVQAEPILHRVFCIGYVLQEDDFPGKLDVQKAKKLGVKSGPLLGQLKNGLDVTIEDGTMVKAKDVMGEPQKGRKVVILGDTHDPSGIASIAKECTVMTHESTLEDEQQALAVERGHSCPKMAAGFAKSIQCKHLILTHFSARFGPEDAVSEGSKSSSGHVYKTVSHLKDQAKHIFGDSVFLAADFRSFEIKKNGSVIQI